MKDTFESIEKSGRLLYRFIRGSHCHGINTPTSDVDEGAVFIAPTNSILGLGLDYQPQVADERNDTVWYEIGKYMQLLIKSNPTILESLFVDDKFVLYEHPIFKEIKKHRDAFITQECFPAFYGYSKSQIIKASGYKKKCVNPVTERKGVLDFCYTFYKQGSISINSWLGYRGLEQRYCGLNNIANMFGMVGCFYDWGMFWQDKGITYEDYCQVYKKPNIRKYSEIVSDIKSSNGNVVELEKELEECRLLNQVLFIIDKYGLLCQDTGGEYVDETLHNLYNWYEKHKTPIGYRGIIKENSDTTQLRLSSVEKDEIPICHIAYNENGFSQHALEYKNYQEWEKNRNQVRFSLNKGYNFDAKNMCECFRLTNMAIEIANGEGVKVNRENIDRQFLLDVKNHKYSYDELMKLLQEKSAMMDEAIANTKLPKSVDTSLVNDLLLMVRNKFIH